MARSRDGDLQRLRDDPVEATGLSRLAQTRSGSRATKPGLIPADPSRGYLEATPFRWRILTGTEKQLVRAYAVKRLDALGIPLELQGASDLEDECSWQILAMAMRDADIPGPANEYPEAYAADVDELRNELNDDERDILITEYLDYEEEVDPSLESLAEAELIAIEHAAKKKSPESLAQLMNFGSRTLALCLRTLASRHETSDTSMSGGSPES